MEKPFCHGPPWPEEGEMPKRWKKIQEELPLEFDPPKEEDVEENAS